MAVKTYLKSTLTIFMFSLLILLSTSAKANTNTVAPNSSSIVKDNIEYYMQTDKAVYDVGETVDMLYRVTNVGEEYVDLTFTYGPLDNTCNWMVDQDGIRIWDNLHRPVTCAMTYFGLGPSQSYEYMHTWDMTDNDGDNVSLGNYTVTGALGYYPGHERIVPVSVHIDIIRQPTHYVKSGESIQTRIDDPDVVDGDIVIVDPGTYFENINFNGKNITLRSTDPNDPNVVAATIIDGGRNGSVVTFNSGEDANCVLNGFTITNGSAEYGGGICRSGQPVPQPPPPPPPLSARTLSEQSSPGILSELNLTAPTIKNCIISNNSADIGGGMYNCLAGSPTLTNCTFNENSADRGGGIFNDQSTLNLMKCNFFGNSGVGAGGGMCSFDSSLTLTNCTFNENSAGVGGGMCNYYSSLTLTNCTFNENVGVGMYSGNSSLTLTNCTFNENIGRGMHNYYSNPTLTGCTFNENSASYGGGGMYNYESSPILTNCTFTYNSAIMGMYSGINGTGGGMYNYQSNPTLTNCTFNGNSAWSGGGIYNRDSSPILTKCTFTENFTTGVHGNWWDGGGMYNDYSNPTLTNCIFSGNVARWGGGIRNLESNLSLNNCTFTGNSSAGNRGGIHNTDGITTLANCILWGNRNRDGTDESAQIQGTPINVDYSCIQGWTGELGGTGNIGADPCFVVPGYFEPNYIIIPPYSYWTYDWIGGDYHLLPDSLCINAGDPNYIAETNEKDLDGKPRVMGGRIDMGAYESPIFAKVRIVPQTINLASKGNWITCYFWLPEQYNVADVEPNSILLQGKIEAESVQIDEEKQVVTAKFHYEQLQEILYIGVVELCITTRLMDATVFHGKDVIKVTNKESAGKPYKDVQAGEPNPADGATNVAIDADLSWTPGPSATSRDVYFGTANPPPFIGNQTATTFDPGTMDYETTYYWRIDEIKKWGIATGDLWSFTTLMAPPPPLP